MAISNKRKRELKWEAIDAAFNLAEYWEELRGEELTAEEFQYMRHAISRMAKHVGITNHFLID